MPVCSGREYIQEYNLNNEKKLVQNSAVEARREKKLSELMMLFLGTKIFKIREIVRS